MRLGFDFAVIFDGLALIHWTSFQRFRSFELFCASCCHIFGLSVPRSDGSSCHVLITLETEKKTSLLAQIRTVARQN